MLLCCGALGIVGGVMGLIQDSNAKAAYARGDYAEAQRAAETGKRWLNNCMMISLAIYGIMFLFFVISSALKN
jgi:hypothetical protein